MGAQQQVREFHEKHDLLRPARPTDLEPVDIAHRVKLMAEELMEYQEAATRKDIAETADALADLLYVVLGTAVSHGIDMRPVFDEVHRSNMTKDKLDPITRKGGKGPNYQRPVLAPIILKQLLRVAS